MESLEREAWLKVELLKLLLVDPIPPIVFIPVVLPFIIHKSVRPEISTYEFPENSPWAKDFTTSVS